MSLINIQSELNVPKNQRNDFGKYNYRSCEDILEALKPLLKKHDAILTLSDDVRAVGERIYIVATATITVGEQIISSTGWAREPLDRKGMDASQITGAASSYARKYALNGLFAIDDNKDSDAIEISYITADQAEQISTLIKETASDEAAFLKWQQVKSIDKIRSSQFNQCLNALNKKVAK